MRKTVLITGATSGIGEATALLLAQNNFNLIVTGRRQDRLLALKAKIEKDSPAAIFILNFDIRNEEATKEAISMARPSTTNRNPSIRIINLKFNI